MKVNEIFGPTIQGEGKSSGKDVLFVRLSLCNLHCIWCDTPYTWNWLGTPFSNPKKFDREKEVHEMTVGEIATRLVQLCSSVKSVVISGGEPMLQQNELVELLKILKKREYWVEVETNGTVFPTNDFLSHVDQINCSPKLATSGNAFTLRERPDALRALSASTKVNFKFVVAHDDDLHEIESLIKRYEMKNIYLMPEGQSNEALNQNEQLTRIACEKYGYTFTDRLHIRRFGAVRAV